MFYKNERSAKHVNRKLHGIYEVNPSSEGTAKEIFKILQRSGLEEDQ